MEFETFTTEAQVRDLVRWHNENSEFVVIDTETTSVDARSAKLLDVQLSGRGEETAVLFPFPLINPLLELDPRLILVAHNYKYDAHVLYRHGVDLREYQWRDTMLMGHLLDENRESYSLDSYVKEYWQDDYKERFWAKNTAYETAPYEERTEYACRDIVRTEQLYRKMLGEYVRQDTPGSLIGHVQALAKALLFTEMCGIEIDLGYTAKIGVKVKAEIEALKPEMRGLVQEYADIVELKLWEKDLGKRSTDRGKAAVPRPEFSFDSSKQLISLLYNEMGFPVQTNEKTKAVSVDEASLDRIKDLHPVIPKIQAYRGLQKVYGTYIEGTLERIQNGRIYPEFRVNGTVTGRISHSNPNLGQLPKSGGVRGIYRAAPGTVFISADYSQLEVCLEANLTGDENLARIFKDGLSKHDITSRELSISRDSAKTLNFALQYWASHFKVAKLLGVSEAEGQKIWNAYWALYAGPKRLKAWTDSQVDSGTPLVTKFGRRRRFEVRKRNPWDSDYRQAYNFLIQSLGADITSRAFYLTSEWLRETMYGRGLFTVHDELLIEVKRDKAEEAEQKMLQVMVGISQELRLEIPLKAESSGPMERWED